MSEPVFLAIGADIASVISLALTGLVWWQTRAIKRSVMRNARVPDALRDLEKLTDDLLQALKGWPELEREANGVIARADSVLINVLPKLVGAEKKKIQEPKSLIRKRTAVWGGWDKKSDAIRHDAFWEILRRPPLARRKALRQLNQDYKKEVLKNAKRSDAVNTDSSNYSTNH